MINSDVYLSVLLALFTYSLLRLLVSLFIDYCGSYPFTFVEWLNKLDSFRRPYE